MIKIFYIKKYNHMLILFKFLEKKYYSTISEKNKITTYVYSEQPQTMINHWNSFCKENLVSTFSKNYK